MRFCTITTYLTPLVISYVFKVNMIRLCDAVRLYAPIRNLYRNFLSVTSVLLAWCAIGIFLLRTAYVDSVESAYTSPKDDFVAPKANVSEIVFDGVYLAFYRSHIYRLKENFCRLQRKRGRTPPWKWTIWIEGRLCHS